MLRKSCEIWEYGVTFLHIFLCQALKRVRKAYYFIDFLLLLDSICVDFFYFPWCYGLSLEQPILELVVTLVAYSQVLLGLLQLCLVATFGSSNMDHNPLLSVPICPTLHMALDATHIPPSV